MSQPFEIDTDALGRAEAPFRELAQRLVALSDQVQSQVRGLGEVWGDDESGQGFVAKYGPARDELLTAFRSTGEVVTSTADGVRTMAQGFQRTEESNHDASSQLLRRAQAVEGTPLTPTSTDGSAALAGRRMRMDMEPTEPARAMRATAIRGESLEPTRAAAVRGEPAEPMVAGRRETVAAEPMVAGRTVVGQPLEPVRAAAVRGEPAQPLEPVRAAAVRGESAQPLQPTSPARMDAVSAEVGLRTQVDARPRGETFVGDPGVTAEGTVLEPTRPVVTEPARTNAAEPLQPLAPRVVEVPVVEPLRPVSRAEVDVATPDESQRA